MPDLKQPEVTEVQFRPPAFLSAPEGRQLLQSIKLGGEWNDKPAFKIHNIFHVVRNAQPSLKESVRKQEKEEFCNDEEKQEWIDESSDILGFSYIFQYQVGLYKTITRQLWYLSKLFFRFFVFCMPFFLQFSVQIPQYD